MIRQWSFGIAMILAGSLIGVASAADAATATAPAKSATGAFRPYRHLSFEERRPGRHGGKDYRRLPHPDGDSDGARPHGRSARSRRRLHAEGRLA